MGGLKLYLQEQFGILELNTGRLLYCNRILYSGSGESFQLLLLMGHQFDQTNKGFI
jgi:hypothetical protein